MIEDIQHKYKKYYFILVNFIFLLSSIKGLEANASSDRLFVVNIDSLYNLNPKLEPSDYLKNYSNIVDFKFNPNKGIQLHDQLDSISLDKISNITLYDESFGVLVPFVKIIKDNEKSLIPGKELIISKEISDDIIPKDYFDNSLYQKQTNYNKTDIIAECIYKNPGSRYVRGFLKAVYITNIVSISNYNIGLILGQKGLKVMEVSTNTTNLMMSYIDLDSFMNSSLHTSIDYDKTNEIEFKQIFMLKNIFNRNFDDYVLAGLTYDYDLLLFNITENRFARTFAIKLYSTVDRSYFKNVENEIIKIGLRNNIIVIAFNRQGFIIFNNVNKNKWNSTRYHQFEYKNETHLLNIMDMILNKNTIYFLSKNLGMIIFDMNTFQYVNYLFVHPNLKKFDYTNYNGVNYIGIAIDNDPPLIPEFFIEIINNCVNEYSPIINKIFLSENKLSIENIISDIELGVTYAFDRLGSKMLILTRAVPNILPQYNFQIDMSDLNLNANESLSMFLFAERGKYPSSVVIRHGEYLEFIRHFEYSVSTFACNYKTPGEYIIEFTAPGDCSHNDQITGKFVYNSCWYNTTYNLSVTESLEKLGSSSWIIIAIIIFTLLFLFLICLWRLILRKMTRRPLMKFEYQNPSNADTVKGEINEMVEVQFDN